MVCIFGGDVSGGPKNESEFFEALLACSLSSFFSTGRVGPYPQAQLYWLLLGWPNYGVDGGLNERCVQSLRCLVPYLNHVR